MGGWLRSAGSGWVALLVLFARGGVPAAPAAVITEGGDSLAELERDLRDRWPDKRQRAVRRLASLGTRAAWEHVIEALGDRDGRVADEAELALAGLDDARLLGRLLGKDGLGHRDEWIRVRVAEALGRMAAPLDARALTRHLRLDDEPTAIMLLWSIERRARAGSLGGGQQLVEDLSRALRPTRSTRSSRVRAAAICALALVDAAVAEQALPALLSDPDPGLRSASLEVRLEIGGAEALPALSAAIEDPSAAVRTCALIGLERRADRAALHSLVDRLEREPRSALRWRIVASLQRLTGFRHRLDPRPWGALIDTLPPDWRAGEALEAGEAGHRTLAFAGLPLLSDRLVFLVDFSGSLWRELEDGRSRKQVVDQALRAALESLPPQTRFNVIPYTDRPHPWRDGLVDASPRNVRRALEYFEACRERGTGNFHDAALLALSDPEADTIVTLTDGAPTGGRRWDLDLMIELLLRENRARRVVFDSVLVDSAGGNLRRWRRLAEATGGRSIRLEL